MALKPRSGRGIARLRRSTRRRISALTAAACALSLIVAALAHPGVFQADLDVNNGGIWVTSTSEHLVARLNYASREVDGAIRTSSADFDVSQNAEDVLVSDTAGATVSSVNTTLVEFSSRTQLTQGISIHQGGDRVAAVNSTEGTVRATTVAAVGSVMSTTPVLQGMPGVVAVTGVDGTIHAVSADSGQEATVAPTNAGWETPTIEKVSLSAGTDLAITAVGSQAVILERGTGVVHLPNGKTIALDEPGLAIQQPGPEADAVLLASRTALYSVPLDGSPATKTEASESGTAPVGVAAQPVRLGGCTYAAWSGSGQFLRRCGTDTEIRHDEALASSTTPVFRVNRDAIILNDIATGTVWLPDEELVLLDDWTDVTAQTDDSAETKDDSAETSDSQSPPERTEENHAPEANDDTFGVRPGRSTLLPVLANDSDPDGDVLTAVPGDAGSTASVTTAQSGLALRLDVPADATGTITVPYTADDGRGLSDSAVATVEIRDWSLNGAPEQQSTPTLTIAEGASGSLDVLGQWLDPDGDSIYLVSAQGEGFDVKTSNEGTVTVRDTGAGIGVRTVTITVSDGQETATGVVNVDVQSADTAVPLANADHVRVVAGSETIISPLDNDSSPTGEELRLAGVSEAPVGTTVDVDMQADVLTFLSEQPQTYYLTYDAIVGAATSQGVIRVDVVERSDPSVPPEVEVDTALLRDGGSTTIAPLANDFDPAGGVLVLQSANAPADSGITVTVVDHSLLQITAAGPVAGGQSFEYTVSNGTATATGKVDIVPVASSELQLPVVGDDTAVVRVDDVVTVSVLDNDSSPSGLSLSVVPELESTGESLGTAWVSENSVRFKAGQTPGRTTLIYTIKDTSEQTASGSLVIEVRARDDAANTAPMAQSLEARTVAGSPVAVTVPLDGIDADGDSVTLVGLAQPPAQGVVEMSSSWLTYTPTEGAAGPDTFTYQVQDRFGAQATGTVRVGVAAASSTNTPPVAANDLVVAPPGRTVAVDVLSNDLDADGDPLSLDGTPTSDAAELGVSVRESMVLLTLPSDEGVYSAQYTVSDSRGGTDTGTLTVQVLRDAPLLNPVGVDDYVTLEQVDANGQVTVPVLDNDIDADGTPWDLTVSTSEPGVEVVDQTIHLAVEDEQRMVLYTVTDADGLTGSAVVIVPARSDLRPRLNAATVPVTVPADTTTDVPLKSHILTRAGTAPVINDASTISLGTGIDRADLADGGTTVRLTPTAGFTGRTSVTFEVADSTGSDALVSTLTLPITVSSTTNTPPVFTPTEISVAAGEAPVTADLAAMTRDADKDTLTFSIGEAPSGFSVSLAGSVLSVAAADSASMGTTGSLPVTINDGVTDPVESTIPLRVTSSTRPLMTSAPITLTSDGSPVSVDVSTLVTNPFPGQGVTLSGKPQVTSGQGTVSASGTTVTISPTKGYHGRVVVQYRVLDATGSESRAVSGLITVSVAAVPGAPIGVRAKPAGATTMVVSWTPGPDNGSPIIGYTITETGGAGTWTCMATVCGATGLTPGGTYSFQVVAHNASGDSPPSAASTPQTLSVTPDVPSAVQLSGQAGAVRATWQAVSPIEGVSISYEVQLRASGSGEVVATRVVTGTEAVFSAPAVTVGSSYRAVVRAVPSAGTPSAFSWQSNDASPYGKPGAPGAPQVEAVSGGVSLSWAAAAANGAPVSYQVTVSGDASKTVDAAGSTSATIALSPGSYTFTVTATNSAGSSTSSATSYRVTATPLEPSTPVVSATGVNGQVRVTTPATARAGNGWHTNELTVQYSVDGVHWTEALTFDGLTDGSPVTVQARVVGSDGGAQVASGAVSATAVSPYGPPSTPTVSCAVNGQQVDCMWSAGASGGLPTSYEQATSSDGANLAPLSPGQTASFNPGVGNTATWCVRATNSAGQTPWACASGTVQGVVPVGTVKTFWIDTDSPDAVCSQQDLNETGYPANSCWRLVIDIEGMNPNSTVSCSYVYHVPNTGANPTYQEDVALDGDGEAHKVFPHRSRTPNSSVKCTQK